MIYVQSYFLYSKGKFLDCGGNIVKDNNFIKLARYSNYLLNKTGKELHFWGNKGGINLVKSLGLNYHVYNEFPQEYEGFLLDSKLLAINQLILGTLIKEDFFYFDLDVLIFDENKLPKIEDNTLFVSHKEFYASVEDAMMYCLYMLSPIEKSHPILYKKIKEKIERDISMYNMGIFGGRGSQLSPIFKKLYDFYIEYFAGKYEKNTSDGNKHAEAAAFLGYIQVYLPMYFREKLFVKEIYKTDDKFKKNFGAFNDSSFEIGMAHLITDNKNNSNYISNIDLYFDQT